MNQHRLFSLVFLIFAFLLPLCSDAWVPVDSISAERMWFVHEGDSVALAYKTSHALDEIHPQISRVILNIHGSSRESEEAYDRVINAGDQHDRPLWDDVAVICPQFLAETDLDSHQVTEPLLHWNMYEDIGPSWCYGVLSMNQPPYPRPFRVNSYRCLQEMLNKVLVAFPEMENLVIAGHSAGGQILQRYSMINDWDLAIDDVRILYIYANPGTYAYLDPERYVDGNWDEFAIPSAADIAACPTYDDWPFGLQNIYQNLEAPDINDIRSNYATRHVIQWLSELDTLELTGGSGTACQPEFSGDLHRFQRGTIFYNYVEHFYGERPSTFIKEIIPDVGHWGNAVYASEVGRYYLFDYYQPVMPGETVDLNGVLTVPNPETVDGVLTYSLLVENLGDETRTGDFWVQLISQNGGTVQTGLTQDVIYEPGLEINMSDLEFEVATGFPLGDASLVLNVGAYPDAVTVFDAVPVIVSSTTVIDAGIAPLIPRNPRIRSISPNPFNAATNIEVEIPTPANLSLAIYDILGRRVQLLQRGIVRPGIYTYSFNGDRIAAGVYFLQATTPLGYSEVRKLVLVP